MTADLHDLHDLLDLRRAEMASALLTGWARCSPATLQAKFAWLAYLRPAAMCQCAAADCNVHAVAGYGRTDAVSHGHIVTCLTCRKIRLVATIAQLIGADGTSGVFVEEVQSRAAWCERTGRWTHRLLAVDGPGPRICRCCGRAYPDPMDLPR